MHPRKVVVRPTQDINGREASDIILLGHLYIYIYIFRETSVGKLTVNLKRMFKSK